MTRALWFLAGVAAGLALHKAIAMCSELSAAIGRLSDPYLEEPQLYVPRNWLTGEERWPS